MAPGPSADDAARLGAVTILRAAGRSDDGREEDATALHDARVGWRWREIDAQACSRWRGAGVAPGTRDGRWEAQWNGRERRGGSAASTRLYVGRGWRGSGMGGWHLAPALSLSREDSRLLWGLQVCKLWTFTAHMFEGKAVECTARSLLLSIMHCLTQ